MPGECSDIPGDWRLTCLLWLVATLSLLWNVAIWKSVHCNMLCIFGLAAAAALLEICPNLHSDLTLRTSELLFEPTQVDQIALRCFKKSTHIDAKLLSCSHGTAAQTFSVKGLMQLLPLCEQLSCANCAATAASSLHTACYKQFVVVAHTDLSGLLARQTQPFHGSQTGVCCIEYS